MANVILDPAYAKDLKSLEAHERKAAEASRERFGQNPRHPGLRFKAMAADTGWRTYRVNEDIRVAVIPYPAVEDTWVLCHIGHHEMIDEKIKNPPIYDKGRHEIIFDGSESQENLEEASSSCARFGHWSDLELDLYLHLDEKQIQILRHLERPEDIFTLEEEHSQFFNSESADNIRKAAAQSPAEFAQGTMFDDQWWDHGFREAVEQFGPPRGLSRLFNPEEIKRLRFDPTEPIEDWMIFLHPDQTKLVDAEFRGAARVRGPAGTGKTVVALHRAATLAERYKDSPLEHPVLFVTFVSSLVEVQRQLYRRLPKGLQGKVRFIHIDALAREICGRSESQVGGRAKSAFVSAHHYWVEEELERSQVFGTSVELASALKDKSYMETEIFNVIKGRGIKKESDYLSVDRRGRKVAFPKQDVRPLVWKLYERYKNKLIMGTVMDHPDHVSEAVRIVEAEKAPRYRCVIVDEAQDLTLMQMRLVKALAGSSSDIREMNDRLFITGDVKQRVYSNFWTLKSDLDIDVQGRATVLRDVYRSTAEIMECAVAIAGSDDLIDIDEEIEPYKLEDEAMRSARHGRKPQLVKCGSSDSQREALLKYIRAALDKGIGLGDIAVLVATNDQKDLWASYVDFRFREEGGAVTLNEYGGRVTDAVKVGTYDRAKGLGFKIVLLPDVAEGQLPWAKRDEQTEKAYSEYVREVRSRFYVACTRAREDLAFFFVGEPSEFMTYALDYVEYLEESSAQH